MLGILKSKFNKLKEIGLDAAVLTSIDETDFLYSSETDTAEETCIPEPLTFIFKPSLINFSKEVLINKIQKLFKPYKKQIIRINSNGRLLEIACAQHFSQCRKEHKCGRINSCYFYEACHLLKNENKSFTNKIMQYKSFD